MAQDFNTLESIFRMITPSSFVGASSGNITPTGRATNIVQQLMIALFETPGGGVYTYDQLINAVTELTKKTTEDQTREFKRVVSILGPDKTLKSADGSMTWPYLAYDLVNRKAAEVQTIRDLFGQSVADKDDLIAKPFSIITINSPMISPQRRDAERVEIFLNSIPSIVMSRCVPYLDMEFGFIRPGDGSSRTQLQATSLLKFLLGADGTEFQQGSATKAMIDARRVFDPKTNLEHSTAGMELFTAPQTLVNLDPAAQRNRYTNVLDPFRPFASLSSVTIDIKPTVGVYSFKKATVVIKLHDRSRLSEIADLIRPTIYTQTTIWLTYGWRHPFEHDNPYATFINNNMLKREAYGIYNSQFTFDQSGGVDITLELYTKAASEVQTVHISQNLKEYNTKLEDMKQLSEQINAYRQALHLDSPRPGGVEIRGAQLLNAASRGAFPEFAVSGDRKELLDAIKNLKNTLSKQGTLSQPAAQSLISTLQKIYIDDGKTKAVYNQIGPALRSAVSSQFKEAREGLDPYYMFAEKDKARQAETGVKVPHPFTAVLEGRINQNAKQKQLRKDYASFGKVFSVFIANSIMTITGIDEVQLCMYQMNAHAGIAGGTNIAEFPVFLNQFEDAYREEIERKASDSFTIEEFLTLLIRNQIDDMRSIAYGFTSYFESYDKSKNATVLAGFEKPLQSALDGAGSKLGPFVKPQIEVYMETVFARNASETGALDLLQAFSAASSAGSVNANAASNSNNYRRILRIHIYDRALNPYESATKILKDNKGNFVSVQDDWLKANVLNDEQFLAGIMSNGLSIDQLQKKEQSSAGGSRFSSVELVNQSSGEVLANKQIKQFVSRAIPSIIYGTNASTVSSVEMTTKNDPLLVASQLTGLNKNKQNTMDPNGSGMGGLPLRVLPAALSMKTLGCPLLNYSQFFFVDMNTGTSLDNVYGITGLTHTFTPGRFDSNIQFGFYDAYGRFEGAANATAEIAALTKAPSK